MQHLFAEMVLNAKLSLWTTTWHLAVPIAWVKWEDLGMIFSLQNGMELFAPTQVTHTPHATTFGLAPCRKCLAPACAPDSGGILCLGQLGISKTMAKSQAKAF